MDPIALAEVLRSHAEWLAGTGGIRADLSDVDLRGANLSRANLSRADLSDANLSDVDLRCANLSDVDLRCANLSRADLSDVDLSGANLSDVDLRGANLSDVDLSGANLRGANLRGANLSDVDLSGADLSSSNLSGAKGLVRAEVSWHGHGERGRRLLAVRHSDRVIYYCGCFRGRAAELEGYIAAGPEEHRASRTRAYQIVTDLLENT